MLAFHKLLKLIIYIFELATTDSSLRDLLTEAIVKDSFLFNSHKGLLGPLVISSEGNEHLMLSNWISSQSFIALLAERIQLFKLKFHISFTKACWLLDRAYNLGKFLDKGMLSSHFVCLKERFSTLFIFHLIFSSNQSLPLVIDLQGALVMLYFISDGKVPGILFEYLASMIYFHKDCSS